jgi:kynurenine formamidase
MSSSSSPTTATTPQASAGAVDTGKRWWPSRFGSEDEHGMLNYVTEAKRLEALDLVRHGQLYDLGRVLDEYAPVFPGRFFRQTLITTAHHVNAELDAQPPTGIGLNKVNWVTEIVTATMQLGTHIDALCHLQIGDRGYNGWTVAELAQPAGVSRLGVENTPQIVTRGWLVDVARERGVDRLDAGEVIAIDDVKRALGSAEPAPGDAVLFHTGWGAHWASPKTYVSGEPGPGIELAEWLAARCVALTGCDTWSYGPTPAEDPECPFEVAQTLNARHGVFIVENLDTAALAEDGVRDFALILTHPKLRGATGAWTSPIALV